MFRVVMTGNNGFKEIMEEDIMTLEDARKAVDEVRWMYAGLSDSDPIIYFEEYSDE